MTSYTSFSPSSTSPPQQSDAGNFASQVHRSVAAAIRPWQLLLDPSALSLPISFTEATYRIRQNLYYFRMNYALIALLILFLGLLFHPISIIVFLIVFVAWLYLYFFRDEPLELLNRVVDDRLVLVFLGLVTVGALILTRVWRNVVVSLVIGLVLVCLHAAIRAPEDFDDQESPYGSLLSVVDSPRGSYSRV